MKSDGQKRWKLPARLWKTGRRALGLETPAGLLCLEMTAETVRLAAADRNGLPRSWERESDATDEGLAPLPQHYPPGDHKVILALNPADVLVRRQVFPSTDPREIAAMVPFQAAALLPLPADEFIVRHRIGEEAGDGQVEVAIVAVRRSLVEQRVATLRDLGYEIEAVGLSSELIPGEGAEPPSSPQAAKLDFLPPAERARKRARTGRSRFLLTAGLVLYCLLAATYLVEHRVRTRQDQLEETYAYLQVTDAAGRQLNRLQAVNDRMTVHLRGSSVLDWLRELAAAAPEGVTLSEVTIDQGVATVVRGHTSGADRSLDYVEALRRTPLGGKATLEFAGSGNAASASETSFEIRIAH